MKIEKGVEIPAPFKRASENSKLAEEMQAGDSVVVGNASKAGALRYAILKTGARAVARKVSADQYRVWKLEPKESNA